MDMLSRRLRQTAKATVIALGVSAGSLAAYCGAVVWAGNFHIVAESQLYRSAQLNAHDFADVITAHNIRSILNLRGAHPGEGWYDDEIAAAGARQVTHYDVPISAYQPVTLETMQRLVEILRAAPKPLLIHCKSGADRTGLVAALYRYAIKGQTGPEAESELSIVYGHFPYLASRSGAMDESFRVWAQQHRAGAGG